MGRIVYFRAGTLRANRGPQTGSVCYALVVALCAACSGNEPSGTNDETGSSGGSGGSSPDDMSMGGTGEEASTGGTDAGEAGMGGTGAGVQTMTPKGDPPPSLEDLADVPATEAPWTILVYGHGDHNLSYSLLMDMNEMAAAEMGSAVQLVVLADWDASQTIAGMVPPTLFPDGLQLYLVVGGGAGFELVAQAPEANLDDPLELAIIIRDVFTALPATRRGLVLWDHGGGWNGGFGSDTQNGTVRGAAMQAQLVAEAVRVGFDAAGITESPPLDFLAFDTCLMAGAEVAFAFRDLASVYIANAELDYGVGWDYAATLTHFAENPTAPMAELAVAEVSHWDAHHASSTTNDRLLRSHAALDVSQLDAFALATSQLTQAIVASETFDAVELGRSAFFALAPYSSQFEKGSNQPGLRDIGQLLSALGSTQSDVAVAQAAQAARQALDGMVLASSQGDLRAGEQAGVHVEQTLGANLTPELMTEYRALASEWVAASRWDELLDVASLAADDEPPIFEHAVLNAEGASPIALPLLQFTTEDPTAAKAAVHVAIETSATTIQLLGLVGAGLVDAGVSNDFGWDGGVIGFEDGQPGMLDVWLDVGSADQTILTIPGLLIGIGELPVVTYLVFGAAQGIASAAVVAGDGVATIMTTFEIVSAFPTATFAPTYWEYGSAPEPVLVAGNPMSIPAEGFTLFFTYMLAGNYTLMTSLTDIWGNTGTQVDLITLTEPLGP